MWCDVIIKWGSLCHVAWLFHVFTDFSPSWNLRAAKLSARRTALIEKLTGPPLFKDFLAFYGTRRFITAQEPFTCPYPEPDQSSPGPHLTFWKPILILSNLLCLRPSGFHNTALCTSPLPLYRPHVPPVSYVTPEENKNMRSCIIFNIYCLYVGVWSLACKKKVKGRKAGFIQHCSSLYSRLCSRP
jgi:hypothetical protein